MKKARAFKRDAHLGIRIPDEDKRRLVEAARKMRRDTSSLALEFILGGIRETEAKLGKQFAAMS